MNICVLFYSYFIMFLFKESSGFRKSSVCVCVCLVEDCVEPLVMVLRIFARSGPKWRQPFWLPRCMWKLEKSHEREVEVPKVEGQLG